MDVEYRFEICCLLAMIEALFSGERGVCLVIVLAQWSRVVERGYREIARMRQMMDVSMPMRACCIGDGIRFRQCGSYMSSELVYCLDHSLDSYISPLLYTALIPLC